VAREMKMPFWKKLTDEQKVVRVDRIFQKERDKARDAIWRKYRTSLIAEEKALAVN